MATWNIDAVHSTIGFKVKHLVVSTVRGAFTDFSGTIEAADNTFANAQVKFEAKVASVATHNAGRDAHLQAPDFFDAAQFPTIAFVSKSFVQNGETFDVKGDFTMHGVTKEVTLTAKLDGVGKGMQEGTRIVSFDVSGVINRHDYGVGAGVPGTAVSENVTLDIQVEATGV